MKKITTMFVGFLALGLFSGSVLAEQNAVTSSTNDLNRNNGWAHVNQLSKGVGTTDLEFISTRAFWSCFEYRIDNEPNTVPGDNPNILVVDGRWTQVCVNNSSVSKTIAATEYVEVRMVYGAETDERFDWTRFDVLYQLKGKDVKKTTGGIWMEGPSQKIQFNAFDQGSSMFDKGKVEYWNYDYPGVLHYTANVMCASVNQDTRDARYMFQIPEGLPGLSGLYVVSYVMDGGTPGTGGDLYGHSAIADLNTAMSWCETGDGYNPSMYSITNGNLVVHK